MSIGCVELNCDFLLFFNFTETNENKFGGLIGVYFQKEHFFGESNVIWTKHCINFRKYLTLAMGEGMIEIV